MGIQKTYLRFLPKGNLNLIADSKCNVVFVTFLGQQGRYVAVGACEHVYIWDLRLGEKVQVLSGEKVNVTFLAASPTESQIAAGYDDGSIKIFDLQTAENTSIFLGHNSDITSLAYDQSGHRLVSGSSDTEIIVWDVIAESGMSRLTGHKDIITKVCFMQDKDVIISSSKDSLVKFWDLKNDHNFKTVVGHHSEVWSFTLVENDRYLITGSNDGSLKVWEIDDSAESVKQKGSVGLSEIPLEDDDEHMLKYPLRCNNIGGIQRLGKSRVCTIVSDFSQHIIACHGNDNLIEIFSISNGNSVGSGGSERLENSNEKILTSKDKKSNKSNKDSTSNRWINRLSTIPVSRKPKSLDIILGGGKELRVCAVLEDNTIELHSLSVAGDSTESKLLRSVSSHGHRTAVRAVCFSSDNLAFATASKESVKLWNRPTLSCLRTVDCKRPLSLTFVPGDRHLIAGLADGKILIIDIATGDILEEIQAHEAEIWSITPSPTLEGIVSGGGDKSVKFWSYELVDDSKSEIRSKVLSLLHYKTLKLEESVLCMKISPNNRFLAVSLLDSTVKIFFVDTFKFFTSLYGHKLPVLCLDISSDSTLIATGSADRNIKIWGLDFGDCHKSLFAHDDSVTGLAFVPQTHYIITCGKDGGVKQWDGDSHRKIISLQYHKGQAYDCAVSPNGIHILSSGSDKIIRIYERSSELLVPEDEAEEERAEQEKELATHEAITAHGKKNQIPLGRRAMNSDRALELILECLEVCKSYQEECSGVGPSHPMPPLPPIVETYGYRSIEEYVMGTLKHIRPSDIDGVSILLQHSDVREILMTLPNLMHNWNGVEIVVKLISSLIRMHHEPIAASQDLLPILKKIEKSASEKLLTLRNIIGYNMHSMAFVDNVTKEAEDVELFSGALENQSKKMEKKRRKEKGIKRAIMTL
ncbi:hypothetical protein QAD02_019484 [Eretmocerus hayati]|uniref:Uncharacterized protein n=1 Tax=Eretmocerus hayati TaxID=131215 RepID=A0ACC2PK02_9HYME|nr:hypothetical protein QAD02_019484 [Eretmocerus hayati]